MFKGWTIIAGTGLAALASPALAQSNYEACLGSHDYGVCTAAIQSPEFRNSPKQLSQVYEARAEGQLRSNPDGAFSDVEQAIKLDPSYYRPWGMRAALKRFGRGDNAGALADVSRALQLDPSIAGNWALRADIYADLGNIEAARADYARAHSLDPRLGNVDLPTAVPPAPVSAGTTSTDGDIWATCVGLEDPVQSGIQMIYAFRNRCTKEITISFCMKATFEAAGDWNLCSNGSYKTYDIAAGQRFEFPFTPVRDGDAMSDGRVVRNQEVRANGAACIGSSPSVYVENKQLVFQHC